jgi:biotin carboxyl carrier protein
MTFTIEIAGRSRTVSIERTGRRFRVAVDEGNPHVVDAVHLDASTLSLLLDEGKVSREVWLVDTPDGDVLVHVNGVALRGRIAAGLSGLGRRASGVEHAVSSGPLAVASPMPGKIVRLLVEPGQSVRARQPVVVVEAMKMENELRAPKDGLVREIRFAPGMSVEAGVAIVVIE